MKLLVTVLISFSVLFAYSNDGYTQNMPDQFEKGIATVNHCTPWHHIKCVYITTKEVYQDGLKGRPTRHWWHRSYIGQACTRTYGNFWGSLFEGIWIVPHYVGVGLGNGCGLLVYRLKKIKSKPKF